MLQRGFLRLSKRKKNSPTSSVASVDSVKPPVKQVNQDEWTKYDDRLIDAAYRSDAEKIRETIKKKGTSPVKVSRDGQTALHISVKKNLVGSVEFMLGEHPDLSTTDIQGRTVYHIAAANADTAMLKKLLDYSRWNLDLKDVKEMTVLHYAVSSGDNSCVKILLDNNAPADLRDGEGRTPLLLAIINGHDKIAMTLILHGVDVNAQDYRERTPIIMSCIQGMREVVALLISKGADSKIADAEGKTLEDIAAEAGHMEIVDILRNGADSGIVDIDHEDTTVSSDNDQTNEQMKNSADEVKLEVPTSTQSKRKSMLKHDESSFTTSIIESLMGYDVTCDTISEMSATEDQLHMKEKIEQERREMETDIEKRDRRIEELENELAQLKSKLRWETEVRFAAEKEVLDLKLQLDNTSVDNQRTVSFADKVDVNENEEQPEEEQEEQEIGNEEDVAAKAAEHLDDVEEEEQQQEKEENEEKQEEDTEGETKKDGYESDDSVSLETGYRKKSLGTAKQHIDMLEEHILSLEEDLVTKDAEINELEEKLQSAKELVDLNNNTTVSLEVFNQYKAEKKTERNKFKEEIKGLESQVEILENKVRDMEHENSSLKEQSASRDDELSQKKERITELRQEARSLQHQLRENEEQYSKDVQNYREHLIAVFQNNMDSKLEEILGRIVKLRITC